MKRLNIDKAPPVVKTFLRDLMVNHEDLELKVDGDLVCKMILPSQFSETEQRNLVQQRWELIRKPRQRNKRVHARSIERNIREAVDLVRQKRQ